MGKAIEKLLSVSSEEFSPYTDLFNFDNNYGDETTSQLLNLLKRKNGFYAFKSALRVFTIHSQGEHMGLIEWNAHNLWKNEYEESIRDCLFFAEDVFGGQFCIKNNDVLSFDPETGDMEFLASDIEGWAKKIIENYEILTGYPVAHKWQEKFGVIPTQQRLLPKIPFVAGGAYTIDNLYLCNALQGMRYRAAIAKQIRELPDGAEIKFHVID